MSGSSEVLESSGVLTSSAYRFLVPDRLLVGYVECFHVKGFSSVERVSLLKNFQEF